jgi:hypothetical protein
VNSKTTKSFWDGYLRLPDRVREQAKKAYTKFSNDPYYPGLHFKQIHSTRPIYSVRITKDYRAIGIIKDGNIIWFWIGSHSDYDKMVNQLRNS